MIASFCRKSLGLCVAGFGRYGRSAMFKAAIVLMREATATAELAGGNASGPGDLFSGVERRLALGTLSMDGSFPITGSMSTARSIVQTKHWIASTIAELAFTQCGWTMPTAARFAALSRGQRGTDG